MDRTRFSTIAHRDHLFCNPVSPEKIDRLLGLLDPPRGGKVLDVGCGKGEMLLRLIERFDVNGVGVDTNPHFLAEARARAAGRVPPERLVLHETDFTGFRTEADSFDAALCIGSSHACGGLREALFALQRLVRRGGAILIAEGYWKREPEPDYLAAVGAQRADYLEHGGNVGLGAAIGLTPLYSAVSSEDEWDHYEGLYARAVEQFACEHPDDPDRQAMLERARGGRDTYLRWGRDTLGFGFYLFMK